MATKCDVLDQTKVVLERDGWLKGDFYGSVSGAYCLVGAVCKATVEIGGHRELPKATDPDGIPYGHLSSRPLERGAIRLLRDVIEDGGRPSLSHVMGIRDYVVEFNDEANTVGDVMEVLDTARDRCNDNGEETT